MGIASDVMEKHRGKVDPVLAGPARAAQSRDQRAPAARLHVESDERHGKWKYQPLELFIVDSPQAGAALDFVSGAREPRLEIDVVVGSDHIGRGMVQNHVLAPPMARRQSEKQRIAEEGEKLV